MSKLAILILTLAFVLADVSTYKVNVTCSFAMYDDLYTCSIENASVLIGDEPVNVLGNPGTNTVTQVWILNSQTVSIIREIFDTFPDLTNLDIRESGLKQITPNVFRNASKLNQLYILGNEVKTLQSGAFVGLEALKFLYITFSKLAHIEVGAFADLPNLTYLNLENNLIENIHEEIFVGLDNLGYLALHNNRINFLPTKLFHPLRRATEIHSNSNQIKRLDNDMFLQNGFSVQRLSFQSNKINSVGPRFFENLVNISYFDFRDNICTDSDLFQSNHIQPSSFFAQIRTVFSTCFNNFVDESTVAKDYNL